MLLFLKSRSLYNRRRTRKVSEQAPILACSVLRRREHAEGSIQRYTAGLEAGGTTEEYADSSAAWRGWRRDLLAAEWEVVLSLCDEGKISPEVMRRIERNLDLQESRLGG